MICRNHDDITAFIEQKTKIIYLCTSGIAHRMNITTEVVE